MSDAPQQAATPTAYTLLVQARNLIREMVLLREQHEMTPTSERVIGDCNAHVVVIDTHLSTTAIDEPRNDNPQMETLRANLEDMRANRDLMKDRVVEREERLEQLGASLAALRAERDALKTTEEDLRQQASGLMAANSRQITVIRRLRESVDALVKERDGLIRAGNAMAHALQPGPIPASEPTAMDYILADWESAIDAARSSGGKGTT